MIKETHFFFKTHLLLLLDSPRACFFCIPNTCQQHHGDAHNRYYNSGLTCWICHTIAFLLASQDNSCHRRDRIATKRAAREQTAATYGRRGWEHSEGRRNVRTTQNSNTSKHFTFVRLQTLNLSITFSMSISRLSWLQSKWVSQEGEMQFLEIVFSYWFSINTELCWFLDLCSCFTPMIWKTHVAKII